MFPLRSLCLIFAVSHATPIPNLRQNLYLLIASARGKRATTFPSVDSAMGLGAYSLTKLGLPDRERSVVIAQWRINLAQMCFTEQVALQKDHLANFALHPEVAGGTLAAKKLFTETQVNLSDATATFLETIDQETSTLIFLSPAGDLRPAVDDLRMKTGKLQRCVRRLDFHRFKRDIPLLNSITQDFTASLVRMSNHLVVQMKTYIHAFLNSLENSAITRLIVDMLSFIAGYNLSSVRLKIFWQRLTLRHCKLADLASSDAPIDAFEVIIGFFVKTVDGMISSMGDDVDAWLRTAWASHRQYWQVLTDSRSRVRLARSYSDGIAILKDTLSQSIMCFRRIIKVIDGCQVS